MPTAIPDLDSPPAAPTRSSPTTFATRADAWVAWLETWAPDFHVAAAASESNASESYANALAAQAAANGVGAAAWVSASNYAVDDVATSPANGLPYRCIATATGRVVDPSEDPTYWALAAVFYPGLYEVTGTTVALQPWGQYVLTNAAATTATLPATMYAGQVVWVSVANERTDNVIARNGHKIMGVSEDLRLNDPNANVELRYINATLGLRIISS